jgi:hypothetical protein
MINVNRCGWCPRLYCTECFETLGFAHSTLRGVAKNDANVYPELHSGLFKFNPFGIVGQASLRDKSNA